MKTLAAGAACLAIWCAVGSQTAGTGAGGWPTTSPFAVSAMQLEASPSHVPQTELNTVIRQYCIRCHNQRLT